MIPVANDSLRMKTITFEISKSILILIGIIFICFMMVLNRYRFYNKHDKVEGQYIDWTELFQKNENIQLLLPYFKDDTAQVLSVLSEIKSPYMVVYYDSNIRKVELKALHYSLKKNSGSKVSILINKENKDDIEVFAFISFALPYILLTFFISGIWVLIITVFFEKTDAFIFSFPKKKKE
ncbi:MAG: hypothetical protein BWY27_00089 [Bacteroidetes bacterium ADurb.Bin234]|nr:MAG: hypothetical protein BWY27_00089 [Bacteroidetes bacterium ADurb.Bin234]